MYEWEHDDQNLRKKEIEGHKGKCEKKTDNNNLIIKIKLGFKIQTQKREEKGGNKNEV